MDVSQLSYLKQRDAEQLFAGALALNPMETIRSCSWLEPSEFVDSRIRQFWTLVKSRVEPNSEDTQATETTMQAALESGLAADVAGWMQDIGWSFVPQAYANEISRRQYISRIGGKLANLAAAIGSQDDEQIRMVVSDMFTLDRKSSMKPIVAFDVAEKFAVAVEQGKRSVDTFIPPIDSALGGLERQTLTILAARPSMGKTALAWQIARNVAASGQRAIFFSMEMSDVNLWGRAACPIVGTTWRDVRAGKLNKQQRDDLLAESYKLAANYDDKLIVLDGQQTTETLWRIVGELRPDLVVADHLRLFKDRADSEVKRMGMITERLKDCAKAFNVPVLLAAQLNRGLEMRGDNKKRPTLADLRDSGEIEENADIVLMLYRDSYYNDSPLKAANDPTELWIRKFRDGPSNVLINLYFDPKKEWFEGKANDIERRDYTK